MIQCACIIIGCQYGTYNYRDNTFSELECNHVCVQKLSYHVMDGLIRNSVARSR